MRALTTRVWRRRRDDRGAVVTLVAMLLGVGGLLGISAIVVDAGQLHAEKAQLQNGADAAAVAVAQNCGSSGGCNANFTGTAVSYANGNANDGTSNVDLVCGADFNGRLPACPANDTGCVSPPPSQGYFVEVHTSTRMPNGATLLPPSFGQILLGSSYQGRTVHACARAGWGGPSVAYGLAMTISLCNWQADTASGTSFYPAPSTGLTPPASAEQILLLHTTVTTTCPGGPSGWDLPGGFGWLTDPNGNCTVQIDLSTGIYTDNTGVPATQDCQVALQNDRTNKAVLLIPVYDGAGGTGHTGYFHLKGFASFVLTGYHLPGMNAPSTLTGQQPCSGSNKCLSGYFTQDLIPAYAVLGGPAMGANEVQLTG